MEKACLPTVVLVGEGPPTSAVEMSVVVNYLKSRMGILILNAHTGMDTNSQEYEELSNDAVNAIKQVCMGVKGVSPQELTELLQAISEAPLNGQWRDELRNLFNQKLSNDPNIAVTSSACTKVEFPEQYLRKEDWDTLMDSGVDVNSKLYHLATLWANLGLMTPTETSAKNIAALGVLTEQEIVVAGPLGVQHLRTFKKFVKDCAGKVRASNISNCPGVYTGFVDELQKSFPQWYSKVYSDSPPVGCPPHLVVTVKRMQATMGCRSSKTGCGIVGSLRTRTGMGQTMQMMLNMQRAPVQAEQGLPGLVVYPNRVPAQSMGQGLPGPLALADMETAPTPAPTAAAEAPALPAPPGAAPCCQGLPGSTGGLGNQVAAMQAILRKKVHQPSDDEDGHSDEEMAEETPTPKKQPKKAQPAKTPPKKPVTKGPMKRPAAAKPTSTPSKASSSSSLAFPGTKHRAPLVYGSSKVYFGKQQYRLMECIGDRVCVTYRY